MSMIALSGTRTSSLKLWPSGLANAWTVTSRGMSWADTRATHVMKTIRKKAAPRAARDRDIDYFVEFDPGQTVPWFCFVTGASPL